MVRPGLSVLGGKATEAKCLSHYIVPQVHTVNRLPAIDVDLDHRAEAVFVRFLHEESYSFPPLSILLSLVGSHYAQPAAREWGVILRLFD